ncbi:MAG TPA: hypothetical protein VM118_01620 [Acidobacteriota bacterium]|nr:hypothetical protein [Acidobacteriota bacterium]
MRWRTDDSVGVAFFDIDARPLFQRISARNDTPSVAGVELSDDGTTILVGQNLGLIEGGREVIYSRDGTRGGDFISNSAILASPHGRFFCTIHNEATHPVFAIYDSAGEIIRSFRWLYSPWAPVFITDELLFVANQDSARFIECATGLVRLSVSIPWGRTTELIIPDVRYSPGDSLLAVYDRNSIHVMGLDGVQRWARHFYREELDVLDVAIDAATRHAAILLAGTAKGTGFFQVVALADSTRSVPSPSFEGLKRFTVRGELGRSWFQDGLIAFRRPEPALLFDLDSEKQYETLLIEFDAETGAFGDTATVPGLIWPVNPTGPAGRYFHYSGASGISIIEFGRAPRE